MVQSFFNNNASSILGAIGGIGSFFGNQIGSALSSSRSWKNTKRQMYLQDELNRAYTRDSYGLMRQGLEKAGYNPLLALGSSAQQALYSGSAPATDSDTGDQAVNSAMAMKNFRYQNDLLKEQAEGQQLSNSHQRMENKKLENELNTSPKNVISDIMNDPGNANKHYKKLQNVAKVFGFKLPDLPVSSANSSKHVNHKLHTVVLHNNNPYVQKGVPMSVVRNFEKLEKHSAKDNKSFYILPDRPEWNINYNEVQRRMRKK